MNGLLQLILLCFFVYVYMCVSSRPTVLTRTKSLTHSFTHAVLYVDSEGVCAAGRALSVGSGSSLAYAALDASLRTLPPGALLAEVAQVRVFPAHTH